mgnify:CR=1 FL=1
MNSNHKLNRPFHKYRAQRFVNNVLSGRWRRNQKRGVVLPVPKNQEIRHSTEPNTLDDMIPTVNRHYDWTDEELLAALEQAKYESD